MILSSEVWIGTEARCWSAVTWWWWLKVAVTGCDTAHVFVLPGVLFACGDVERSGLGSMAAGNRCPNQQTHPLSGPSRRPTPARHDLCTSRFHILDA